MLNKFSTIFLFFLLQAFLLLLCFKKAKKYNQQVEQKEDSSIRILEWG